MNVTSAQGRKSKDVERLERLCRMLRSTSQNYPQAKLLHGMGGFGASLGEGISIWIRWSGQLAPLDLRDLLALFATWLVVDPERLVGSESEASGGVSRMANEQQYYSNGRLS